MLTHAARAAFQPLCGRARRARRALVMSGQLLVYNKREKGQENCDERSGARSPWQVKTLSKFMQTLPNVVRPCCCEATALRGARHAKSDLIRGARARIDLKSREGARSLLTLSLHNNKPVLVARAALYRAARLLSTFNNKAWGPQASCARPHGKRAARHAKGYS